MKNTYYSYFIGPLYCIQSCVLWEVLGCFQVSFRLDIYYVFLEIIVQESEGLEKKGGYSVRTLSPNESDRSPNESALSPSE